MSFDSEQQSPTAITAIAPRSCLGSDLSTIVAAIASGAPALSYDHDFKVRSPMGLIPGLSGASDERLTQLFKSAIAEALTTSDLRSRYHPRDIGLIIGTTTYGYSQTAAFFAEHGQGAPAHGSPELNDRIGGDALLAELCRTFELSGYGAVIGTACTSAAMAIHLGHRLVDSGQVAACLAGGFDVITPMTVQGFSCLQLLDENPTRPFSPDRAGINLGEGGAIFAIEPDTALTEHYALGYIFGGASTCDAHDLTTPDPKGTEIRRCIAETVRRCQIYLDDIALINTHGTGTPLNDAAESLALSQVFGARFDTAMNDRAAMKKVARAAEEDDEPLVVEATKPFTGHLLGGAGALEAALALAMPIPEKDQTLPRLSCSFGFGGSNVCLALSPSPLWGGVS